MVEAIYFALTDAEASGPGRRGERVPSKCGFRIDEIATHGPSPKALAAVIEAAGRIDLYPDWTAKRLREAIGEKYGFDPDHVCAVDWGVQFAVESVSSLVRNAHPMKKIGIEAIYRKPNTSRRHPKHPVYPYLLRDLKINRPNQVFAADITYVPMKRGFIYLFAVMDWASRRVLSWRLSNTMTTGFCIEAVQEAIHHYGTPEFFNTDQGSQFTSLEFTQLLKDHSIAISIDGKGCWRDNVFVERLWKSIKYEEVYLHAYETVSAAKSGIGRYLDFYNSRRPHSALNGNTPDGLYFTNLQALKKAA